MLHERPQRRLLDDPGVARAGARPRQAAMSSRRLALAGLFVAMAVTASAAWPDTITAAADAGEDRGITIQVTSNGWHSAIVVPRAAMPADAVPEAADFPDAAYLGFGWGDAEYFPEPEPTFAMTLRAGLTPTRAVMHVSGLDLPVGVIFPSVEVVDLTVTAGGFRSLVGFLHDSFARGGADRVAASAPGLYRFSKFYPATGRFHMLNTCNTWTARGLAAAGLPVEAGGTRMADDLMTQLRPLARTRATN